MYQESLLSIPAIFFLDNFLFLNVNYVLVLVVVCSYVKRYLHLSSENVNVTTDIEIVKKILLKEST